MPFLQLSLLSLLLLLLPPFSSAGDVRIDRLAGHVWGRGGDGDDGAAAAAAEALADKGGKEKGGGEKKALSRNALKNQPPGITCQDKQDQFQGCFKPKGNQTPKEFLQKQAAASKKSKEKFCKEFHVHHKGCLVKDLFAPCADSYFLEETTLPAMYDAYLEDVVKKCRGCAFGAPPPLLVVAVLAASLAY